MQQKDTPHVIWLFLRPVMEEFVIYALVVCGMIGYALYRVAVDSAIGADSRSLVSSFTEIKDSFLAFLSQNDALGTGFLFGLWFLIGSIVYMLVWALATMLIDMNRDIRISSSFIHPRSFHQSDYWFFVLGRASIRLSGAISLVIYGVIWATTFAPVWITSFETLFAQGWSLTHIIDALMAIIGIGLTLHIAAILLRVTLLRLPR